jgi:hypothetical protein
LLEGAKLGIVNLNCRDDLTIEEPQGVDLGGDLVELLSNQGETHFREGYDLEGLRLDLESLTLGEREVISLDCL